RSRAELIAYVLRICSDNGHSSFLTFNFQLLTTVNAEQTYGHLVVASPLLETLETEGSGVWPFLPRRKRERTIAGGTRAFFSAYHRNNESSESRTLKRVRGLLAPLGCERLFISDTGGCARCRSLNPRLIS